MTAEAIDFIRLPPFENLTTREQKLVSAFVRGAPFDSWAGPVNMAVGLEWRSDNGTYFADENLFLGDALGFGGDASVDGEESVREAYMELSVPLAEGAACGLSTLVSSLAAAIRVIRMPATSIPGKPGSNGNCRTRCVSARCCNERCRAPGLPAAFTEPGVDVWTYVGNNSSNDPCSASRDPVGSGLADACVATGIPLSELGTWEATPQYPTTFYWGGNPDLEPEKSDTVTVGIVLDLELLEGMQVSVDYFDIKISETIGGLDATAACFDIANTQQQFCDRIVRNPSDYNVIEVRENNANLGLLRTRGFDVAASLEADLPAGLALFGDASLSFDLVWTHALENSVQASPFGTVIECVGQFGWPCESSKTSSTFPENRILFGTTYRSGEFDTRLSWSWIDGTHNNLIEYGYVYGADGVDWGNPYVPAKTYLDLSAGYRFSDRISLRFNVENLTDSSPPIHLGNWCCNTDPRYYDYFGRAYSLALSLTL